MVVWHRNGVLRPQGDNFNSRAPSLRSMPAVCLAARRRSGVLRASIPKVTACLSLPPAGGSQGKNCLGNTAGAATSCHRLVTSHKSGARVPTAWHREEHGAAGQGRASTEVVVVGAPACRVSPHPAALICR